jgi:hypothetical protein
MDWQAANLMAMALAAIEEIVAKADGIKSQSV